MTTIVIGDIVKLTSKYARSLMKRSRSNKKLDWLNRRGVASAITRSEIRIAWPDRKSLDPVPHAGVEKA